MLNVGTMNCIIHYSQISFTKKITRVDEQRWRELLDAKECRLRLGGKYLHEQIQHISGSFRENLFYHRECYANFTRARSDENRRPVLSDVKQFSSNRIQRSYDIDLSGRFPNHCWFCKSSVAKRVRTKSKDKLEALGPLEPRAFDTLLAAARKRNDETLLRCIEGENQLFKGFLKHTSCYREYRDILYEKSKVTKEDRYEKVREAVEKEVFQEGKCLSLDDILDIKGEKKNCETRKVLKKWIVRNFDLLILTVEGNVSQVIVSKDTWNDVSNGSKSLNSSISSSSSDSTALRDAAGILQDVIYNYIKDAPELPWPPTIESLKSRLESTPEKLTEFLRLLLTPQDTHHITTDMIQRHVSSFAQDIIYSLSRGSFLTLKHTCVGLGLHSMTGMKIPIVIMSRLGNSISYDMALEIETAMAEVSQQFDSQSSSLPLQPINSSVTVPTVYWFDNYDSFVDNNTGAGSIHNTPGVAFQEKTDSSFIRPSVTIPKSKKRSLSLDREETPATKVSKINPKKNPPQILANVNGDENRLGDHSLELWKIARHQCRNDQRYPRFTGFVIELRKEEKTKTMMTYLPPIEKPITDYGTLFEVLARAERLSLQANMKYTNITMDCGAAMKLYHVLWNNPSKFSKIIVHLGDFHFMQAFFDVIGRFVTSSGFEDIVYQLGLCQPGSMHAMIKGKHNNQSWMIHELFAEAIV